MMRNFHTSRKVWFQLLDARGAAFEGTDRISVRLTNGDDIDDFVKAVKQECDPQLAHVASGWLRVFATLDDVAHDRRLSRGTSIGRQMGRTVASPLFVRVPDRVVPPVVTAALPPAATEELAVSLVPSPEVYLAECGSLQTWEIGKVHDIPTIHAFFQSLGGCTDMGKLMWRKEDHDVATFILGGLLGAIERLANKKALLVGSPGVGKSTLLCLLAFHVVFKHKKNVLIYRRLKKSNQENCLVYLGHDSHGQVVFSTVRNCKPKRAIAVYDWLIERVGFANAWLFLDGFVYEKITVGLGTFRLLATSQQADLLNDDSEAYSILHSCWKTADLFALGTLLYKWNEDTSTDRFYYSGGSAREFTRVDPEDILIRVEKAVALVKDVDDLFSPRGKLQSGDSQIDRLRHTFVNTEKVGPSETLLSSYLAFGWEQVVDSEYALLRLYDRLCLGHVEKMYHWAKSRGPSYASLAGQLFEILIHSLASHNVLMLTTSPYEQGGERGFAFKPVAVRHGSALLEGTESDFKTVLSKWRDDDNYSYWYPNDPQFSTIDAIIKLKDDDLDDRAVDGDTIMTDVQSLRHLATKKVRVAYLQITLAKRHGINLTKLKELNEIFDPTGSDKPMFVVLCPSPDECQVVRLDQRNIVDAAQMICNVCVGYKTEVGLDWKSIRTYGLADRPAGALTEHRRSKRLRGISATSGGDE